MKWKQERVSSFANVITGGTPSTTKREYWENGTIPWINSGDLNQGIVTVASDYITEEGYKSSSTKIMPIGSVLIALTGATTGLTALLKLEACANQSVTGILPSEKHYPEFLYYYFRTQRDKIIGAAWGGAQPHINQKYVKEYIVPLPEISDQIKIAKILGKAEVLISQRKKSIQLLDEFLKSTFLKMFGDPVRNEQKWKIVSFGDIVEEFKYGTNMISGALSSERSFPILRIPNIIGEKINYKDLKYSNIDTKEREKITLKKDDVLFVRTNGNPAYIARCAVFNDDFECGYASYLIRARLKSTGIITSNFIRDVFNFPSYRKILLAKATTTAGNYNINTASLKSLKIYLPPKNLQAKYEKISEQIEQLKKLYIDSLRELENLFNSLSQKAFSGRFNLELMSLVADEENSSTDNDRTELSRFYKPKTIEVVKMTEAVIELEEDKRYGDPFECDEATAKKQGAEFYKLWKEHNKPKKTSKEKVGWEKVSSKQIAEWVKDKYSDSHFSSEMLANFLMNEHVTFLDYYSSEDLKKKPHLNGMEDLKSFVFSALNNENPFIKLEQHFYDAENENFILQLNTDDYQLIQSREKKERSGIYFSILKQ